jgi:hypothetical protein
MSCAGQNGSGQTTGTDTNPQASRTVSGQLNMAAQTEGLPNESELCLLSQPINVRAVPATGDVVDSTVDEAGLFDMVLKSDSAYTVLFYQDGTLCGILINSVTGEHSLIGLGEGDFDFGLIEFDAEGNLIPENDCEEYYDTDEDGYMDYEDDDFDGDGIWDEEEFDLDENGIPDEWHCDYDDHRFFDERRGKHKGKGNCGCGGEEDDDEMDYEEDDAEDEMDDEEDCGCDDEDGEEDEEDDDAEEDGDDTEMV